MRFLGNKTSLIGEMDAFIMKSLSRQTGLVFFDAFCGTGSVANHFKTKFNVVINDNLKWATVYSMGRIVADECRFERLGFDPFEHLNSNRNTAKGFIHDTYSPSVTNRMYFTTENAGRIDYFRQTIEQWRSENRISNKEYTFLLASLIESVSKVANIAGVYGAFLKEWDDRALKPIRFISAESDCGMHRDVTVYNDKIENIISEVDCDILYIDPPYSQNQYGTQYHLLETLILNDCPSVSKVTGSRPVTPMRSDWSKEYKAHILLDYVLANTKAKYVVMSYNNKGLMSKEYISASMKRYGEHVNVAKIGYKKYQNWKSEDSRKHFEYLFFMKKKENVIYQSPLNYIGNKSRVIDDIKRELPPGIDTFVDAFGGGFNVGININCKHVVYNEINHFVCDVIASLRNNDTYKYIRFIKKLEKAYGMEKGNKEAYLKMRSDYNSIPEYDRDSRVLLALILYGFHQQIRFNTNHEFNNPPGIRWFNDCLLEKLISFSRRIKEIDVEFSCSSYEMMDKILENVNSAGETFFYFDPPYMLTNGSYNDGKRGFNGWDEEQEKKLLALLDNLHRGHSKFMLSYVITHNGETNDILMKWIKDNRYKLICLGDILGISGSKRKEVLITNYEALQQADVYDEEEYAKVGANGQMFF